jgi:hypothetical protein
MSAKDGGPEIRSGTHLAAARNWLLWHVPRADSLTWGSLEEVTLTVRQIEEIATAVADAMLSERTKGGGV